MTARRPRVLGTLALACLTASTLSGCGALQERATERDSGVSEFRGCIVSDDGGFEDRSFNQEAYEGLEAAQKRGGIAVSRADSQSEAEFEPNLTSMVQRGCDLTVAVGSLLADSTRKVARAHPDQHFVTVDDSSVTEENVKPVVYETAQAAFLAGYLAAGVSETGTVGTFGGMDIPSVTVLMDGFSAGVAHYNEVNGEDVEVLGWDEEDRSGTFLSSLQDSDGARTATRDLIEDGADVVLPVAGQASQGAVDAVAEADEGDRDVRLVWTDTDGHEVLGDDGGRFVLTSVLKNMSATVEDVVVQAAGGTFDSTTYVGTLENGGVGLAPYHDQQAAVGKDLERQVQQLRRDVIAGEVLVRSEETPAS